MNKQYCEGCDDNFYNSNGPCSIKECWSFNNAKLVNKKRVSINQRPPWKQESIRVPNCYRESGYVFVDPRRTE